MSRTYRSVREAARSLWSGTEDRVPPPLTGQSFAIPAYEPPSNTPAFECFAARISESDASSKFDNDVRVNDVIAVKVKRFDVVGAYVKPLCFVQRLKRDLEWLDMQLLAPVSSLSRRLTVGEYLHARVVAVKPVKIELIEAAPLCFNQLPEYFRLGRDLPTRHTLADVIADRSEMRNPYLDTTLGFPTRSPFSFLSIKGLESDRAESASSMRQKQDEQLAMASVVKGVEEMKSSGNRPMAIAHFTRALSVWADCVDALVARGAAYSNDGNYRMAEADLSKALAIDPAHANAQKYFVETAILFGQYCELEGSHDTARSKYVRALEVKEDKRVRQALEKLDRRPSKPVEIVTLSDDKRSGEKRRPPSMNGHDNVAADTKRRRESTDKEEREKRQREKQKLREMEAFIKALKNGK